MAGMSGAALFLTYYLQNGLGYTAVATRLAFLPMLAGAITTRLLFNIVLPARTGPRPLVVPGMLLAAAGTAWLTGMRPHSGYTCTIPGSPAHHRRRDRPCGFTLDDHSDVPRSQR